MVFRLFQARFSKNFQLLDAMLSSLQPSRLPDPLLVRKRGFRLLLKTSKGDQSLEGCILD